jgi:hypothetical protein
VLSQPAKQIADQVRRDSPEPTSLTPDPKRNAQGKNEGTRRGAPAHLSRPNTVCLRVRDVNTFFYLESVIYRVVIYD